MSASPQLSKAPGAQPTPERRRNRRRPIVHEQIIAVNLDGDNGGLMLDLAEDGLSVQAVTALQQGKITELAFVLPDSRVSIRAQGQVRWAEASGRAGIRLLAFREGSSADIRAAVLQPAVAPEVAQPPGPPVAGSPPPIDVDSLEREIAARKLDRMAALAYIADRTRGLASAGGIAIALGSRQDMICRASAGSAPAVGVRLQSDTGLSGECVRSGLLVRCDDTEADARVDAEVCRQLDLRSAVLVPILDSGGLRGVLEVFSSRPHAFASDDIRCFEQVAGLVARIMHEPAALPQPALRAAAAAAPVMRAPIATPPPAPVMAREVVPPEVETSPPSFSPGRKITSPALKYGAAVCGVIVLALGGWGFLQRRQSAHSPAVVIPAAATPTVPVEMPSPLSPAPVVSAQPDKPEPSTPAKGLQVAPKVEKTLRPGQELALRELPSAATSRAEPVAPPMIVPAAESLPVLAAPQAQPARPRSSAGGVVAGRLVHRVEPAYPDLARHSRIGGTVVLNAVIRPDGKVGAVEVVSGNPLLARAAVEAVRQWTYEPFRLNGTAVQAEAIVRLHFDPNLRVLPSR